MMNFSSENYAGVHPDLMNALLEANAGQAPSYGNDQFTREAEALFRQHFGADIDVYFTFNGTGANNFGLGCLAERYQAIYCSDIAHLYVDESTAPESFTGCRLYPVKSENGKLIPAGLISMLQRKGDAHHPQPGIVSITQPTEYGTVYTLDEMKAIRKVCDDHNLLLHVDGARLFNAAAALNVSLETITRDAGVDVLTLGGTKIGMMFGEAVVFFGRSRTDFAKFHLKRSMQLASKNRFIAAQFTALLRNNLWHEIAVYTNQLAKMLEREITIKTLIAYPVETNAVFLKMSETVWSKLQGPASFYYWNKDKQEARLIFSFVNTSTEITALAKLIADV